MLINSTDTPTLGLTTFLAPSGGPKKYGEYPVCPAVAEGRIPQTRKAVQGNQEDARDSRYRPHEGFLDQVLGLQDEVLPIRDWQAVSALFVPDHPGGELSVIYQGLG
jgi:hypothetical protein